MSKTNRPTYIRVAFNNARIVENVANPLEATVILEFQTTEITPEVRKNIEELFPNMSSKVYDLFDKEVVLQSMGIR